MTVVRNYDPIAANYFRFGQAAMIGYKRDPDTGQPYDGLLMGILTNGMALSNAITNIDIPDTVTGGLGIAKRINTNKAPSISAQLNGFRSNIASWLLHGSKSDVAAVTTNAKTVNIKKQTLGNSHYLLDHPNVSNVSVTGVGGTPTYAAGADYTVNNTWGSINIVQAGQIAIDVDAAPTDELNIVVTYDAAAFVQVDAMTSSSPELWIRLEGVDAANDLEGWVMDMFKVSIDPLSNMALVNSTIWQPTITLACQADGKRASGSAYYRFWFKDGT